jgi:hypothetical protein
MRQTTHKPSFANLLLPDIASARANAMFVVELIIFLKIFPINMASTSMAVVIWSRIRKREHQWCQQALDMFALTEFQTLEQIEYAFAAI